jgi:hypothetical protein
MYRSTSEQERQKDILDHALDVAAIFIRAILWGGLFFLVGSIFILIFGKH